MTNGNFLPYFFVLFIPRFTLKTNYGKEFFIGQSEVIFIFIFYLHFRDKQPLWHTYVDGMSVGKIVFSI